MEGGGAVAMSQQAPRFFHMPRFQNPHSQFRQNYRGPKRFNDNRRGGDQQGGVGPESQFDGKHLRKAIHRRTVDYNSSLLNQIQSRVWQRDYRDVRFVQPDASYGTEILLPSSYLSNPTNSITTKFVRTSTNKVRCPIFCVKWTPEGRRLVTGASSGEFTLWNGLTFNFETILQAHEYPVRAMTWSHSDMWMVTGDHMGYVKYWQSNMNNVKMFQAHKDQPVRGLR